MRLLLLALLSLSLINCKSDDSDPNLEVESYTYTYDNTDITINSVSAIKMDDRFVITIVCDDQSFAIEFNEYGNLASANSYPNGASGIPFSKSFLYYSSYFLDFNLLSVDTDNKIVTFNFNGLLHENDVDIDSATHSVNGDFNVKYAELTATELSKMYCKTNGNDWHATNGVQSGIDNLEILGLSDDQYIVSLFFNANTTPLCTNQSFDNTSSLKMGLSSYNPSTDNIDGFDVSGAISITEFTAPSGLSWGYIEGTYNFNAINSSTGNSISVTDGTFKQYFSN